MKSLLLAAVSMTMVVNINCRDHWRSPKSFQDDDDLGPPISDEEMAAAMANTNLPQTAEDNYAIEDSGEFEGDIILTPEQQAAMEMEMDVRSATLEYEKWNDGVIPYTISTAFNSDNRQVIARAMAEIQNNTCLKFIGRTNEADYINIFDGPGCGTLVGRRGGWQPLSLNRQGCMSVGIAIHELMHVAGFFHEQSRYDRDDYVTIHWENIRNTTQARRQFRKYTTSTTTDLGLDYDYNSVMHYKPFAFTNNRGPTITPKKAGVTIGQRNGLSELDAHGLNLLYNCEECSDAIKNCATYMAFCEMTFMQTFMQEYCPKSCGFCN